MRDRWGLRVLAVSHFPGARLPASGPGGSLLLGPTLSSAVRTAPPHPDDLLGRRNLLRLLTSTDETRADVGRQSCERPGGEETAELLMFLEEKGWARQAMIEELRREVAAD